MKIFFSVGEPSGDIHGANLIRELRRRDSSLEIVGFGGPLMEQAGCALHADLTKLAVMWIARVLLNIHKFLGYLLQANRYFREEKPDAVVLIDYPGFNWWIARRARANGIPVFYYGTPQIWAWASWRVKKMRRFVNHVLTKLPFEAKWFNDRGCNATYIGHPFFDEVRRVKLDERFIAQELVQSGRRVAILPGSRTQEVTGNLPSLLQAAKIVADQVPGIRFSIAAFRADHAAMAEKMAIDAGLACKVHTGRTAELISTADCCMAVSGSVSLELLWHTRPTVILYRITPLAYRVQKWFRKVKYITLVNLLVAKNIFPDNLASYDPRSDDADDAIFPEYLTCEDRSRDIAEHVKLWLTNEGERDRCIARLTALRAEVGSGGASSRGAEYILSEMTGRKPLVATPLPRAA